MKPFNLLIVDDEPDLRWVLRGLFEDAGFNVAEAGDGEAALQSLQSTPADVVLSDVRMPQLPGLELLRKVRASMPDLPVVLLSAVEDIATAVDAIKEGAFDWQQKPYDPERLLLTVQRAAEQYALKREVQELRSSLRGGADFGTSVAAAGLQRTIDLLAPQLQVAVLITGESGTGKEVVAREIHRRSPVAAGPFVAVDCGALPEPLLESQLFGHKQGAFTGADRDRPGLFALAHGGTLFLDELGNLPLPLQAKLLRAVQERAVVPVGGREPVPFDARLLTATNCDLELEMREGRFRIDLYHRVAEFTLVLESLRERPDDVLHFARVFLAEANLAMGRQVHGFTAAAAKALQRYGWPGNLRELRNIVRRATLLCASRELDAADLGLPANDDTPAAVAAGDASLPLTERIKQATDAMEARILEDTLTAHGGNKAAAARALQIDYTTLHRKLKRYGLWQ
ncbi:MAG TPA: sigma-54 dependent transcriptional regulator [Planctomycetota bacterium]|nr:sigma-54 dependent transcriptional regulator [Planctomycetota bacterium]